MNSDYNANNIETLNFREAIRTKIQMYLGSADNQAILQCAREIISNSIDEAIMGYGNKITVELFENNRLIISDEGRGCPFGKREDGTEALEAIYMTPHSGGKFNDKVYRSVIGAHGVGSKGVALSSSHFKVSSFRNGQEAILILKDGFKVSFNVIPADKDKHGTVVEYIPAPEVYHVEPIITDFDEIKQMCKDWSYLNKGLTFILIDHITNTKDVYKSKNGLLDLLLDNAKNTVHPTPIHHSIISGDIEVEIALQWTKGPEKVYTFTNGLYHSEGGTSLTGLRTAITRNMKKLLKLELPAEMLRTGLVYAIACKIPNPSFSNQTKTKINNIELRSLADRAFTEAVAVYKDKYPADIQAIGEFFAKEKKADEAAQRAREAVLNHIKEVREISNKKVMLPTKLKDAEFLGENSTLLVVEGKSAAGSMVVARDSNKYGIFEIKGKMINCLTNSIEDVLNKEC